MRSRCETDARLARIERRLATVAETNEQRVLVLRDTIADFVAAEMAERDNEIMTLKKELADLSKSSNNRLQLTGGLMRSPLA